MAPNVRPRHWNDMFSARPQASCEFNPPVATVLPTFLSNLALEVSERLGNRALEKEHALYIEQTPPFKSTTTESNFRLILSTGQHDICKQTGEFLRISDLDARNPATEMVLEEQAK
jgi:hypothetical protein